MYTKSLVAALISATISSAAMAAEDKSLPVPGAFDAKGNKVLTFISKEPPGQRCNGNMQVAAEIANTYRVSIQVLPSSMAPGLPAPSVSYGNQVIVADGREQNGLASYQVVADVLELEGVPKYAKSGLLFNASVRKDFDNLKATIKAGPR